MTRYIPQRDAAGTIIGMQPDDGRPQVATILEETLKAVGATNGAAPPPQNYTSAHQRTPQPLPPMSQRTIAALVTLGMVGVVILFSLLQQPVVTRIAQPPVVIRATQPADPPTLPTVSIPAVPTTIPQPPPPPLAAQPAVPLPQPEPPLPAPQPQEPGENVQPAVDQDATANAWVAAPASTPTPWPEPGEQGFVESFQEPPECNVFIGYVGPKRSQCQAVYDAQYHAIYATQTAQAQP